MKHLNATAAVLLSGLLLPNLAFAQSHSAENPLVSLCEPLMSMDDDNFDDDGDEEDLTETRRYDLENAERLETPQQIMNALFEEKWNFSTNEPIKRYELCGGEETYVLLWSRLLRDTDDGSLETDAEGYMSFRKDGSFEYVFAARPYQGTWELDGTEMVLTADWLNNGEPYRTAVERIETPVETVSGNGETNIFTEEMYRLGAFRFYRLPTTVRGQERRCSCDSIAN